MATVWLGTKKIYRLAKNVETTMDRVNSVGDSLGKLDEVAAQLAPNGGNSLYDKVGKIIDRQETFAQDISSIHNRLDRLESLHMQQAKKKGVRRGR